MRRPPCGFRLLASLATARLADLAQSGISRGVDPTRRPGSLACAHARGAHRPDGFLFRPIAHRDRLNPAAIWAVTADLTGAARASVVSSGVAARQPPLPADYRPAPLSLAPH